MTLAWNQMPRTLPDEQTPSEVKRQQERRRAHAQCPECGRPLELRQLVAHVSVTMQCPARSCLALVHGLRGSALYRAATRSVGRVR